MIIQQRLNHGASLNVAIEEILIELHKIYSMSHWLNGKKTSSLKIKIEKNKLL
jgi:hypothetical protein